MKRIGVVTVARSDYGIYLPILHRIQAEPGLALNLIVSGMHLSPEFGETVEHIRNDGFEIAECIDTLVSSDLPVGTAKSMGLGVIGFAQYFCRGTTDLLVVLGDRYEMFCAALAAVPFRIPIAHVHGGELTRAAIDDALRHSITKLSHIHFASTRVYAERIRQMGEEPWRIHHSGAPGLDNLKTMKLLPALELENMFGLNLAEPPLLVTFHPVTLEYDEAERQLKELMAVLEEAGKPVIFTLPNADTKGRLIGECLKRYVQTHPEARMVENFGTQGYFSLMALALAMIGNSSSGIIEAASFELPVVNIGNRQAGRIRGRNVIDVGYGRADIKRGLQTALNGKFRDSLKGMSNPYGSGGASDEIVRVLKETRIDERLIVKRFHDMKGVTVNED